MNIVLCYPLQSHHVAQITRAVAEATDDPWQVLDAGQERIAEAILEADIFCGHAKVPVPWDEVVQLGRLRWIHSSAAGMDHCLVPSVIASNITVTSSSGLFAKPVAEQTIALLLGVLRQIPLFFRQQQQHQFVRQPTWDLHGKTVGIVGMGGNGRRIVEVLAPWNVRIVATDMFPDLVQVPDCVEEIYHCDELEQLLKASDIVIMAVPLNSYTHHMMGRQQFAQMRPGSIFINVARGPVVDEQAMVEALREGHLGGAGLDVTESEPLPNESPLWDMENVMITPHVGAQSANRLDVTTDFFCNNLRSFLTNGPLSNVVDKELGFPIPGQ
ncbi:MAG: D-2-hydroxyacid dehydrogenase [Pirellulaceae bacterium]|nr:D-2-hydroxyacid dehydrogenase [Planctomycetales bacterium]